MNTRVLPTPERLHELWRFAGYGSLSPQQPLVAAGDRLLGVAGSTLFAIDVFRGAEPVPDAQVEIQGFPYSFRSVYGGDPYVTAAGGVVYFMDGDELIALRLSDGLPLQKRNRKGDRVDWESPVLQQVSGLLAVDDKVVAVHIGDTGATAVSAFVAVNGEPAFGPVVISELSPGRIGYGDGAVFFVAEGRLHAVNVDFGDARFARTRGGATTEPLDPSVAPCVAKDIVVAAGTGLHFFDVRTGAELFEPIAPSAPRAAWSTPIVADKGRLVIASNSGEVVAVRTHDGEVAWRTKLTDPGEPTLLRGQVLVTTDRRSMLATLSLATGVVERRMQLPQIASDLAPVVINETVFIPDAGGSIEARPFARQHAAYFDGRTSRIDIEADGEQFDFGTDDFTIETWIRSSEGGEIVSSHPTIAAADAHGFRLNLGQNGELRVAIVDADTTRVHAGRTRETRANDGEWHHIALVRRAGALLALLDGKSLDVFFRDDSQAGLAIGGRSALTIGAYRAAPGKPAQHHFQGLIRELRIWDRALDVATVQNNRHVQLTGSEPRLKGLWALAEVHSAGGKHDPRNAVARHAARATFVTAASAPTDLELDRSGFPYLLHEVESHWPYAGTWAARGEHPVSTRAASAGSALAFATNNALYGVRRSDGRRLWQIDAPRGASAPVADGSRFLVLTGDDGVVAINATTGESARVDAFAGLLKDTGAALAAPAVSSTHLAAGAPHGLVRLVVRDSDPVDVRDVAVPAPVRELAFGADRLCVLCGASGALQVAVVDLANASSTLVKVSGSAFTTDAEWLFCVRGGKLTRVDASQPAAQIQASTAITGAITGMAARRDDDLLVVTTDQGTVHGLAMADLAQRWTATIPEGRTRGSNAVSAPAFDAAGRIYCTTASGTVAVLDPVTGARAGLYLASQSITTPPVLAAATAYYGCADPADPDAFRDGALHSVVFGETMVLRLGLDERGSPTRAQPYALVDIETVDVDKHTLHLMDPTRSCVEAWVNVPPSRSNSARRPGGGVLGICPTLAGGFGLNLSIDEDGTLRYGARSLKENVWQTLRAEAVTGVSDGQWHHVAVSRDGADHVAIYVDGQPVQHVSSTHSGDAPGKTGTGIRAFLGATAGDDLEAARPFCGMIAEVRMWDTFLEPAEISARMHVKLRGNEPDLLAYWNFDLRNVEDAGPEHHHGALVAAGADPVWWLTDLAFEKPSYPFVTTVGKVVQQPVGQPAMYEVAFTVHRADGSGMAGHPLDLWYVRRHDDDPTETLFDGMEVAGVIAVAEPEPGLPSPDGKDRVYSLTTGADGTATVVITPLRAGHAPAIDLRAGFMPRNERFHVNVLLDQQTHVVPTPPALVVQSRLIQDYAYSSGGTINEDRDRSTWRTVIRAVNADGSVRVGEPLSLWAGAQLNVEVAGRTYAVNTENAAELVTDGQGEVVIVFDAGALTATSLMARAGFMHRNDRILIAPDQDLHRQLSNARGADFTEKRPTRWKPGMKEGEGEPLLSGDYAPHADKVADAIVTVMAAAKPADADPPPAPRGTAQLLRMQARVESGKPLLRADATEQAPMRQPPIAAGGDRVVTLRTRAHAPRSAPLNPDRVRAALAQNAGFVFETVRDARGKPGVRFELLETREQVAEERGEATPEPVLLRGLFDDIWDGIKDVATDVYEGATKIVVSIADAVEVAIHKMVDGISSIVQVVVNSVAEAVNAVAGFFEQLGVLIMKAIEFLRTLFNWQAILRTKNIVQDLFILSIDSAKRAMSPANIDAALSPLIGMGSMKPKPGGQSITATSAAGGEARSPALDEARGVQGQMVMQKSRENGVTATAGGEGPGPAPGSDGLSDIARKVPTVVPGLLDLSPAEMVDRLLGLVTEGIDASMRLFIEGVKSISAATIQVVDWVMGLLRAEIRIPFLSDLYRWITGSELTLLDLICLAVAVPVHVAHIAVTTLMGETRTFADDNHDLVARLRAAERGETLPPRRTLKLAPYPAPLRSADDDSATPAMLVPPRMETDCETLIIVLRSINIALGAASDVMFTRTVSSGGIGAASQVEARARGIVKVMKGMSGIAASYLTTYMSAKAFEHRLENGVTKEVWEKIAPEAWINTTVFAVLVMGDAITFAGGAKQVFSPSLPQELGAAGSIAGDALDKAEFRFAVAAIPGMMTIIWKRGRIGELQVEQLERANADPGLIMQAKLFAGRDIATAVSRLPWFMFTQTGANSVRDTFKGGAPTLYGVVTAGRAVAQGIALATHVLAVYVYGQRP